MNTHIPGFLRLGVIPASAALAFLFQQGPAKKSEPCWDKAPLQGDLNDCAVTDLKESEAKMNRVFQALLHQYREDRMAIEKLEAAQRTWLAYRDAHMDSYYPEIGKRFYGTVQPMCHALLKARLTEERLRILKEMLNPEEGDVCAYYPSEPSSSQR